MDKRALALALILVILVLLVPAICLCSSRTKNVFSEYLYFDNNGTTPLAHEAAEMFRRCSWLGNASASYAAEAQQVIKDTTLIAQEWIGCDYPVIYTSGASESNNLVLRGMTDAYWLKHGTKPHIITSSIEHKTSLECLEMLSRLGRADVTLIDPNVYGIIPAEMVRAAVREDTMLISIMHANNETGAINDIRSIALAVKSQKPDVFIHSDVVQTFGKTPVLMRDWNIDAISVSMHKLYGPLGLGMLILSPVAADMITPQIAGSQNFHLRGGTENIPAIAAAGAAMLKTFKDRAKKNSRLSEMKSYIRGELLKQYDRGCFLQYRGKTDSFSPVGFGMEIVPLGADDEHSLPNTLLISFVRRGPLLKHFCNVQLKNDLLKKKIVVSIGSACNTASPSPSHVLNALKAPYVIRCGVIRISLGDENTMSQCRTLVRELIQAVNDQCRY